MAVPASFRKDMRALPIATSDEEARAYLQTRLVVMSKLMFWSFVTLLGFMGVVFKVFPEKEPRLNWLVYTISGIGLTQLAMIWRLLLVRRLSITQLRAIDVYFLLGTGLIFAASG